METTAAPSTVTDASISASRRHRTIRPPARWTALDLSELWDYRDLLYALAQRDVRLRYRQTALGALWVLFQPLMAAGIFTFVFNRVAGLNTEGIPYFAFVFAGQLAWMAFAGSLTKTSSSLVVNSALVAKVYFPRLALPLSTLLSTLLDFVVGLAVLLPVLLILGIGWSPGLLLLPVWFLLISMMALGIGLMAGALMVSYRDVQYIVPVLLSFAMYASPVVVPLGDMIGKLGEGARTLYFLVNPLAALIEAFHWSFFGRSAAPWGMVAYAAAVSLGTFLLGTVVFRNMERRFADVI